MTNVVIKSNKAKEPSPKPPSIFGGAPNAGKPKKEGIISRMISIVKSDIMAATYGKLEKRKKDKEDYERFCRMARGER